MKRFTLLSFLLFVSAALYGQVPGLFGVVSTYDYQRTLSNDDINAFDSLDVPLFYVLAKQVDSVELVQQNDMEALMSQIVTNGKRLLVYVHGDHSLLSEQLERGFICTQAFDMNLLIFAWPSNEIENHSIKNYKASKRNVEVVLPRFVEFTSQLSRYCKAHNIQWSLMFHSLGNLFAKSYARYTISTPTERLSTDRLLLNAACVWEYDHDIWVDVLSKQIEGKIFITLNENDRVLGAASTFIEGGDLLGKTPPRRKSRNAEYIDFTDLLRNEANFQESHGYYFGDILTRIPELKSIYKNILIGK